MGESVGYDITSPTIGWMVPLRDAKGESSHNRDDPFALVCRKHRSHIPFLRTTQRMLIFRRGNGCHRRNFFVRAIANLSAGSDTLTQLGLAAAIKNNVL